MSGTQRPEIPRFNRVTERPAQPPATNGGPIPAADLSNLIGGSFVEASRKAIERQAELYGSVAEQVKDEVDAYNLIRDKHGDGPMTPKRLMAIEVSKMGMAIMRAQPGHERTVCALAVSRIGALAASLETPPTPPAEAATGTASDPTSKALESFGLPTIGSDPALVPEKPSAA